jgi:hypothetical protein
MRNADVQRVNIMLSVGALQQARMPHVSHAEIAG